MSIPQRIACLAILCLALATVDAEVKTTFKKHWRFPNTTKLFFDLNTLTSKSFGDFTYAVCDFSDEEHAAKCKLVLESVGQPDRSCDVTLPPKTKDGIARDSSVKLGDFRLKVMPINSKDAVILWQAKYLDSVINCITINMNDCRSSKETIVSSKDTPLDIFDSSVITYGDSYDVVLRCNGDEFCKFNINAQGPGVNSTNNWFSANSSWLQDFRAIAPHSNSAGFLHYTLGKRNEYPQVALIKPDGSKKVLKEIHLEYVESYAVSTAYGAISVATTNKTSLIIWLFDHEGNLKLDSKLDFGYPLYYPSIQNLPDGGFILLTVECPRNCKIDEIAYHVTKFGADGKRLGSLDIESPEQHCDLNNNFIRAQLFENTAKEYCVSFACAALLDHRGPDETTSNLDLTTKCFSDGDFSV